MVDLPQPSERVVTSEAPRSSLSAGDVASPYQQFGNALDKAGQSLEKAAEPLAERAGLQAVTTDANGNIKVDKVPIFGEAGIAYARAIKFAAVAEGEGKARRDDIAIRQQHRDDPQGYVTAANAYRDKQIAQYTDAAGPEVGITLGKIIDGQTTTTYRGLLNEKERLDLQRAESSMRAGIATAQDNLTALANQGVTSGPEWDKWNGQQKALYGEMAANPRLGVSKDMINYELDKFHGELKVQSIRYQANQIYEKDGPNAAIDFGKSILTDQSLKLNDVQRRSAFETVRGEIHMNEAERRQTIHDIADDFKILKESGDASPAAIAELHKRFMDAKDPLAASAVVQYGTMRQVIGPFNKLPLPDQQQYIDRLEAKVADGTASGMETAVAKELTAAKTQTEKGIREGGAAFVASRFPDKIDPLPALDPAKPEQFAVGIAARAKIAKLGEGVFQGGPVPVLGKDEVGQVRTALAGQGGPQVLGALGQALKPDEMQSLLSEKGVRDGIVGMSRSGDPAKMNAAYSFMDAQQKANPLQFDKQFEGGLKDLRAWQSNLAFYPPEEAAKRMMRSYDPDQSAAHAAAIKVADEQLKTVSADKVVAKFSTGFGPFGTGARTPVSGEAGIASGAMKADYDQNYKDGFVATGDPSAADKFAIEKLQMKYAVSPVNGNRVMPHAPERYYPEVGGSHDWMAKQLDDAVAHATGADTVAIDRSGRPRSRPEGTQANQAPRALVSDDTTERDIANGKPPSYQVVLQDGNGRWTAMTDRTNGMVQRLRFDPTGPFAERAALMNEKRDFINEYAGIGPF